MILSISAKTFEGVEIARLKGKGDVSEKSNDGQISSSTSYYIRSPSLPSFNLMLATLGN
jgi:hypothetical protein